MSISTATSPLNKVSDVSPTCSPSFVLDHDTFGFPAGIILKYAFQFWWFFLPDSKPFALSNLYGLTCDSIQEVSTPIRARVLHYFTLSLLCPPSHGGLLISSWFRSSSCSLLSFHAVTWTTGQSTEGTGHDSISDLSPSQTQPLLSSFDHSSTTFNYNDNTSR